MPVTAKTDTTQVDLAIGKLIAAINGDSLELSAKAGGLLIVNAAKRGVHKISSVLASSIGQETEEKTETFVKVRQGTGVDYGLEEEFRPGSKDGTPHSYLRPAYDSQKEAARDEVAASLKEIIETSVS